MFNQHNEHLWPNLRAVDAHASRARGTDDSVRAPDVCLTWRDAPALNGEFHHVLVVGDFKTSGNLFRSPNKNHSADCLNRDGGQLASYVLRQVQAQHLLHAFAFIVYDEVAHLLRFDRSCIVATQAFAWKTTPYLVQFLCAINSATPQQLGQDDTISVPHPAEIELAYKVLANFARSHGDFFPDANSFLADESKAKQGLRKIEVYDDAHSSSEAERVDPVRRFIAPPAHVTPSSIFGRGTAAYLAVEISPQPITAMKRPRDSSTPPVSYTLDIAPGLYAGDVVFLKDTWRIDRPGMEKEGDIYCDLHDKKVPRISSLICAGDVCQGKGAHRTGLAVLTDQQPETDSSNSRIESHRHYRLVLGKVGKLVCDFKSTHELLRVTYHVLEGERLLLWLELPHLFTRMRS